MFKGFHLPKGYQWTFKQLSIDQLFWVACKKKSWTVNLLTVYCYPENIYLFKVNKENTRKSVQYLQS